MSLHLVEPSVDHARVLVVEDDDDTRWQLSDVFARAGHRVCCTDDAAGALADLADGALPDLILLDLGLPTMDGLSFLTQLRAAERTATLPVLVVSGFSDVGARVESFDAGANDFVTKPVGSVELLARARNLLRTARELERLRHESFLDPLTGLLNRHGLDRLLTLQVELAIRHRGALAVLFLDLDEFKRVNDVRGHVVGDRVLCDVARAVEAQLRASDFAARWGGDEFVIVLPGAPAGTVEAVVARLDAMLASLPGPSLDASIGVACLFADVAPGDDTARRLVEHADLAMYAVKQRKAGRARGAWEDPHARRGRPPDDGALDDEAITVELRIPLGHDATD